MSIWKRLFGKKKDDENVYQSAPADKTKAATQLRNEEMSIDDIWFSHTDTSGGYKIVFENKKTRVRKVIVNDSGRIMRFPGIAHPELISKYCDEKPDGQIMYTASISLLDGQYALIWLIQPDGRYWEDEDGFGGTPDPEINLYARIDANGNFIEPFRLFSIGRAKYYGTDKEEKEAYIISMSGDPVSSLREDVPILFKLIREKIMIPEPVRVGCDIPGTVYRAELSLDQREDKWYVQPKMWKLTSSTLLIGDELESLTLDEQREYLKTDEAVERAEEELIDLFYDFQSRDKNAASARRGSRTGRKKARPFFRRIFSRWFS